MKESRRNKVAFIEGMAITIIVVLIAITILAI